MNPNCEPNCQCFCPSADIPAPFVVELGGSAGQFDVTIFGTAPFSASILQNTVLPGGGNLIVGVQMYGNTLRVTTNAITQGDVPASYSAIIQICNACGSIDIPITVQVVDFPPPPVLDCNAVSAIFADAGRPMQAGDLLYGRDAQGACVALQPPVIPPPVIDCGIISALFAPIGRPAAAGDLIYGRDQFGQCLAFDPATIDICESLRSLTNGAPPVPSNARIPWTGFSSGSPPVPECGKMTLAELFSFAPSVNVCNELLNFPEAAGSINFSDRFVGIGGSPPSCRLFTPQQILEFIEDNIVIPPPVVDVCAIIQAFPLAAPVNPGAATIPFIEGGICLRTTITDLAAVLPPPDVCAAISNFAFGAPVDPSQTFIPFIEGGQCQIGLLSTILSLAAPSFPLYATDGSCSLPSYSFSTSPDTGMFLFSPGVLRLSAQNCLDYIDIGASINIVTGGTNRNINITATGNAFMGAGSNGPLGNNAIVRGGNVFGVGGACIGGNSLLVGGSVSGASSGAAGDGRVFGGSSDNALVSAGTAFISGGTQNGVGGTGGAVEIIGGPAQGGGIGGSVTIDGGAAVGSGTGGTLTLRGGTGPTAGGDLVIATAPTGIPVERFRWRFDGELRVNGASGSAGDVLTSNGPGLPPSWAPAAGGSPPPLNDVQDATGSATRSHGTNEIVWQWSGFNASADRALTLEQVGSPNTTGSMFVVEMLGDNMRGITVRQPWGGGTSVPFQVGGIGTTVLAGYDSYPGVNQQAGDTLVRGGDVPAGGVASGGGNLILRAGNKADGAGGSVFVNGGEFGGPITLQSGSANPTDFNGNGGDLTLNSGSRNEPGNGTYGRILFGVGNPSRAGAFTRAGEVSDRADWYLMDRTAGVGLPLNSQFPYVWLPRFIDGPAPPTGAPGSNARGMPIAVQKDGATIKLWIYDGPAATWRSVLLT